MRISDWSSDVCSSDLPLGCASSVVTKSASAASASPRPAAKAATSNSVTDRSVPETWNRPAANSMSAAAASISSDRSEEHTSELQSLMRISYAVFCLKKKKKKVKHYHTDDAYDYT